MSTDGKNSNEEKRQPVFGFPFGDPSGFREMMEMWCQPGANFCGCCPMAKPVKKETSGGTSKE